jgi:hypothetical protein
LGQPEAEFIDEPAEEAFLVNRHRRPAGFPDVAEVEDDAAVRGELLRPVLGKAEEPVDVLLGRAVAVFFLADEGIGGRREDELDAAVVQVANGVLRGGPEGRVALGDEDGDHEARAACAELAAPRVGDLPDSRLDGAHEAQELAALLGPADRAGEGVDAAGGRQGRAGGAGLDGDPGALGDSLVEVRGLGASAVLVERLEDG